MRKQKKTALLAAIALTLALLTIVFNQNVPAQDNSIINLESTESKKIEAAEFAGNRVREEAVEPSSNLITATSYAFTASGAALEDMSSGTTQLIAAGLDDNISPLTNIGFDFWFDGTRYGQFSVNSNGLARLGTTAIDTSFANVLDSTTDAPKIAPYWDDLWIGTNGRVHFKVVGAVGSRKLVIEWQNMIIPRTGTATAGAATFQLWLFESTGVIQFVYGGGIVANEMNSGYTVGLQSSLTVTTNFASVTTATNTVSYTAADNTQTNAIAAGTSYAFTPNVPAAPSGLTIMNVTAVSLRLTWTDNANNDIGTVIYRSTDGVNYTFLTQLNSLAPTAYSDVSLTPGTTYFYRVFALSEGALSAPLTGSQTTNPPGNITSAAAGGSWSNPSTWVGGNVPTPSDAVTIADGATVTIDIDALAYNVTVGSGSGLPATLLFAADTAKTITVGKDLTIASNGTFASGATGTVTTHILNIEGSLINNNVLDFSTNGNLAGATINFTGAESATFGGTGAVTDVRRIIVNKSASIASIIELNPSNFTVQGTTGNAAGFLTLNLGTLKISGTFPMTNRVFLAANYRILANSGIWLNNPNFTVVGQAGGITTSNSGLFRVSQGTYNIGVSAADGMSGLLGQFIIEGGAVNSAGRINIAGPNVSYTQTGGAVTVGIVGNTRDAFASFDVSNVSSFTLTGGTITLVNVSTAAIPIDYRVSAATQNVTGGMLILGTGATATNFSFRVMGTTPSLLIDNTNNNKTATFIGQTLIRGNVLVNPGTTFAIDGVQVAMLGTTFTNNGTVTGNVVGSRFYFLGTGSIQTYTGVGVAGTSAAPLASIEFDSAGGVIFDSASPNVVTSRIILFTGNVTNTGKITLGAGGTSAATLQIGNSTTPSNAGNFDAAPTFNLGSGGQNVSYMRVTNPRTTGVEINPSRSLASMTVDNNVNNLTLAGGNLTVTGGLSLINGIVFTGANVITHNGIASRINGYIDGNLNRNYTTTGAYTYHIGQNGYSPLAANVTALSANPSSLAVGVTDNTLPGLVAATAVSRFWTLTESGALTANLTFTYTDADVSGNEANYKVFKREGNATAEVSPSTVNAANNTAGVTGITNFSDWGIGETFASTVPFATIAGRVTNPNGQGIPNVKVTLTDTFSSRRTALTNGFGNYQFQNIPTGIVYTLAAVSRFYSFAPPSQTVFLVEDSTNINFTGTLVEMRLNGKR